MEKQNKIFTNTFVVAAMALLCCALWGSATPFIKIGYELILPDKNTASTILFAGIRFTLAGMLTVLIYSIARRKFLYPKKENLTKVATVAAFQTVIQYIFFYIGLANTTGVKGTIASGSNAFFAMLIASLIFKQEKLTFRKVFACLMGFAGIIVVNLNGLDFNMNFTGDCFVLFSAIAYAFSSVLIKRYSEYEDPVVISGYQFIIGGLVMIAIGAVMGGTVVFESAKAVAVLVYLAFLSAIAYSLWGVLLKFNPVSKVSIYSFMIPVFGVLLSNLLLTEQSNVAPVNLLITLILVCGGIFILNYKKD
ncbi:MAG: DMT family transporter [Clostridia bacterium]|nr:DMT family transporter [Clostridia bacterium]